MSNSLHLRARCALSGFFKLNGKRAQDYFLGFFARERGADDSARAHAAKRRSCLPSRTSSMILAENASRSEGCRLVISP